MVKRKSHIVPHRRRRTLKTDFRNRLSLLKSGKPRLVVRKSLNNVICQIIGYKTDGDECMVTADSRELKAFGWKPNKGNIPAAYLTGLLCGMKARKKNISEAVIDIGMYVSSPGNRVYAALKGAADAGIKIPHSEKILPGEDRTKGSHISAHAEWLKKENSADYKQRFSSYLKNGIPPETLPEHFDEVKGKILKGK